ncbi:MAG TPA: sodium/proline symporter [Clostridia bacterium]|nr:sodium/proline symporter [Clostridia bacterium]
MVLAVLVAYMVGMILLGVYASRKVKSADDFFLAGRRLGAFIVAISHQAAALSGWLFLAWAGMVYGMGLKAIYTVFSSGFAPITNFLVLAKRLRVFSGLTGSRTIPDVLEARYYDEDKRIIRSITVVIIFICMIVYTASQIMAAGAAFYVMLGWPKVTSMLISALVVIAYTSCGGLISVTITDTIQGIIMIAIVVVGLIVGLVKANGFGGMIASLRSQAPELLSPALALPTAIGLLGAGILGYPGQPHIAMMFMGMKSGKTARPAAAIAGGMSLTMLAGSFLALLAARTLFPKIDNPEYTFLRLFMTYTPKAVVGIFMAAVMAAIMSTADALLHSSTTAVVQDFYNKVLKRGKASDRELLVMSRIITLVVGAAALAIALRPFAGILWVNWWAWGGLSVFSPILVLGLYWKRATREGAIAGLVGGFIGTALWFQLGLHTWMHMTIPAVVISGVLLVVVSLVTSPPPKRVQELVEGLGRNEADN